MESSGFSLGLPAEPEPRNIVPATSSTANQPGVTTSNAAYASAVNAASSALTAEAIRSSASPASLSQKETSASATEQESGWHWADRAQILRSYQRDSLQILNLQDLLSDVIRSLIGSRRFLANQTAVSVLTKIWYFGSTFGLGSQTLGEEYVEIYPYVNRRRNFPSRLRRIISLALLIASPHIITALVKLLATRLSPEQRDDSPSPAPVTRRKRILDFLNSGLVKALPELWFAWFLLKGRNTEWTKSLMGMSYITSKPASDQRSPSAYSPIGMLLLLPLISRTIASWQERQSRLEEEAKKSQALRETERGRPSTSVKPVTSRFQIDGKPVGLDSIEPARHIEENSLEVIENEKENLTPYSILPRSDLVNPDRQCPLCLSPCGLSEESGGTCVTECGHVFCWSCIEDWGAEKMECPLCRQALRLERLTPLYNL